MKQYDHEPTLYELIQQFEEEDAKLPDFIPSTGVPDIDKAIIHSMVISLIETMAM